LADPRTELGKVGQHGVGMQFLLPQALLVLALFMEHGAALRQEFPPLA